MASLKWRRSVATTGIKERYQKIITLVRHLFHILLNWGKGETGEGETQKAWLKVWWKLYVTEPVWKTGNSCFSMTETFFITPLLPLNMKNGIPWWWIACHTLAFILKTPQSMQMAQFLPNGLQSNWVLSWTRFHWFKSVCILIWIEKRRSGLWMHFELSSSWAWGSLVCSCAVPLTTFSFWGWLAKKAPCSHNHRYEGLDHRCKGHIIPIQEEEEEEETAFKERSAMWKFCFSISEFNSLIGTATCTLKKNTKYVFTSLYSVLYTA